MKNSTPRFAILGDGRLARHMRHYFDLLGLPCSGWSRRSESSFNSHTSSSAARRLELAVARASHILLLVSDGAIAGLVDEFPALQGRTLVHCSGALTIPGVAGTHPLMTFSGEPYTLSQYREIPFVVESPHRFEDLLPGLPNPQCSIEPGQKALYHALCVMAGNFPQLLWRSVSQRFSHDLGMDANLLEPYLTRVLENFLETRGDALTGPLARGDHETIQRNLEALERDPLHSLYQSFVDFHTEDAGRSRQAAGEY